MDKDAQDRTRDGFTDQEPQDVLWQESQKSKYQDYPKFSIPCFANYKQ